MRLIAILALAAFLIPGRAHRASPAAPARGGHARRRDLAAKKKEEARAEAEGRIPQGRAGHRAERPKK